MDPVLRTLLLERLRDAELDAEAKRVIEVACAAGEAPSDRAAPPVWLRSVTVEGFRGIGAPATLTLEPSPGLTVVVGRNGSGKSSFAEGLELLMTGAPEALGEAPEGVDGDLAVPAPRRRRRGSPPSWCWRATPTSRSRRSGRTARRTTTRAAAAARGAGARRARLGPRPAELPPVPLLRRAGDDVRHAVLAVRGADAGARAGRHRRARGPARRRPAGVRQPAQDGLAGARRPDRAAGPRRRARRARRRGAEGPQARPRRARPTARATPRTTAATPRCCAASPACTCPTDEEIGEAFTALRVAERAHKDAAQDRRPPRDPARRAAAPGARGPRPRAADRRLPGVRHRRRARRGLGAERGRAGRGAERAGRGADVRRTRASPPTRRGSETLFDATAHAAPALARQASAIEAGRRPRRRAATRSSPPPRTCARSPNAPTAELARRGAAWQELSTHVAALARSRRARSRPARPR